MKIRDKNFIGFLLAVVFGLGLFVWGGLSAWSDDKGVNFTYEIDANAVDSGATTVQGNRTIRDIQLLVGASKKCTLVFKHTGSGVTKAYTIGSGVTLTDNFYLDIRPGAELVVNASTWFDKIDNIQCGQYQQIISKASTASLYFTKTSGFVSAEQWGAAGDGITDDRAVITKAINAAGKLKLRSGTTYFLSTFLDLPSNVQMESDDNTSVLFLAAGANTRTVLITGMENIHLKNFSINGNGTNQTGGTGTHGLVILNSKNISVEHLEITNVYATALWGAGVSNIYCEKNYIHNTGYLPDATSRGIWLTGSTNYYIEDNIINDMTGYAITVQISTPGKVLNNTISGVSGYDGILVYDSDYAIINNNSVKQVGDTGIVLALSDYVIINGNIIENCGVDGIVLAGSLYNVVDGNIIKDTSQKITNTYAGIAIDDVGAVSGSSNVITGNILMQTATAKADWNIKCRNAGNQANLITGNFAIGAVNATNIYAPQANNKVRDNTKNPQGLVVATLTTPSPCTYRAATSSETLYVTAGGTISSVALNGINIWFSGVTQPIVLGPWDTAIFTWSGTTPTMYRYIQ